VIFFIGKQKIVLFLKYKENDWKSAASALSRLNSYILPKLYFLKKKKNLGAMAYTTPKF